MKAKVLPKNMRRWVLRQTRFPGVGRITFGDLRRLKPISRVWGGDRGLAVDRYYIERFLSANSSSIQGRVLEVGDNYYTTKFGGDRVTNSEIVHAAEGNPKATYVADFANAPHLPEDTFDCIICTQTLHLIADLDAGLQTLHRILKPGGTLLVTVPGISQIYTEKGKDWFDFWRFTKASAGWLFMKYFSENNLTVTAYGNVLSSTAFLYGLAAEELTGEELDHQDSYYQMLIAISAKKEAAKG